MKGAGKQLHFDSMEAKHGFHNDLEKISKISECQGMLNVPDFWDVAACVSKRQVPGQKPAYLRVKEP